jgi:excisionase family DNA binding protein
LRSSAQRSGDRTSKLVMRFRLPSPALISSPRLCVPHPCHYRVEDKRHAEWLVQGEATRIDPAPGDQEALGDLARRDPEAGELVLRTADGTEISLPSSLLRLVVSAANNLAADRAVMTIPAEVALTPAEAAELPGLSRPFVARLLERGDIPSELLPDSRHRRIKLADVLAFQDRRERRSEGRRRIADIATTADLPYLGLPFVARVFIDTNVTGAGAALVLRTVLAA